MDLLVVIYLLFCKVGHRIARVDTSTEVVAIGVFIP